MHGLPAVPVFDATWDSHHLLSVPSAATGIPLTAPLLSVTRSECCARLTALALHHARIPRGRRCRLPSRVVSLES